MAEEAKIRVLFENINHPETNQDIEALEVQHDISKMSYMQIKNHLVTKVSKFETASTSKINRNISSKKNNHYPTKRKGTQQ